LREHRLGVDLVESIQRLNKRIVSENLQLFSATVCVTIRTGGSMADVLDHVIETIRQRSAFHDKLKTMISQSEFEAFCISLSPLAAFVILYLLDRKLMTPMLTTPIGWAAIGGVVILEVIGFIVLKKVTYVKF
jgi:tight adherence protein B